MASFTSIAFLALVSHGKAMLTDPGAVPEHAIPVPVPITTKEEQERLEEQKYRTCRRCRQFKPVRAHHCSICERCVIKMDHHCPWINNCVGLGNHKFFLLFILYVFLLSLYAMVLVCIRYAHCVNVNCPSAGAIRVVFLVLESMLFGLFTVCMMCDQYSVITTGATQIDRLKGDHSQNFGVREVFGGADTSFSIAWLLPINIWFPKTEQVRLLGYVLASDQMDDDSETFECDTLLSEEHQSHFKGELVESGGSIQKRIAADIIEMV